MILILVNGFLEVIRKITEEPFRSCKKTHKFNGRWENLYLDIDTVPEAKIPIKFARELALKIWDKNSLALFISNEENWGFPFRLSGLIFQRTRRFGSILQEPVIIHKLQFYRCSSILKAAEKILEIFISKKIMRSKLNLRLENSFYFLHI